MTETDLLLLKSSIDRVVKITCYDGETLLAKVLSVSDEDEDVIYDLVSTTKESHYEKHDEQPAYLIGFRDIEKVESVPAAQRGMVAQAKLVEADWVPHTRFLRVGLLNYIARAVHSNANSLVIY